MGMLASVVAREIARCSDWETFGSARSLFDWETGESEKKFQACCQQKLEPQSIQFFFLV